MDSKSLVARICILIGSDDHGSDHAANNAIQQRSLLSGRGAEGSSEEAILESILSLVHSQKVGLDNGGGL